MSQSPCESFFGSCPELPMLHFRGKDLVVAGKVLVISELLTKVNFVELRDYLLEIFPSKDQLFLIPSTDPEDLPLSCMTVEQIENVIFKKQSNEVRTIIAGDFKMDFDTLKARHESVNEDEQFGVVNEIRDFVHKHILEAVASNALKRFGTYSDPQTKKRLLLLDNRKVFTTDKARVKAAANRAGIPMPSTQLSTEFAPSGRIRRHIQDPDDSDEDVFEPSTKKPIAEYDSDKEFIEREPSVRKGSAVIDLSNSKMSSESSVEPLKRAAKKQHHNPNPSPQYKKKHAKKESAPSPPPLPIKSERPEARIPKKAPKKALSSSSESSSSSSDSESSEQGVVNTTYARDNYWLCSVNLQQRIDAASFSSLWEMRDCVANLHGIAQKSNMGNQVQEHWLDLLNFLNLLLQSIGGQSHSWALQQIRERFGTSCGVSKKNKKLADRIIRDNLKNQMSANTFPPIMQPPFMPVGNLRAALPVQGFSSFQPPGMQYPNFQPVQQPQQFPGSCFNCHQQGHVARNCPQPLRRTRRPFTPGSRRNGQKDTYGNKKGA